MRRLAFYFFVAVGGLVWPGQMFAACVSTPVGLVAWWPMGSNGVDVVGGHNGTLAGSYSFVGGEVGLGLNVSGTIGGASVADNPDLDFGPGVDFTIELWTRPVMAATAFGAMGLVDKRMVPNIAQSKGYALAVGEGQLAFQMSDSLDKPFLQTARAGPELRDGAWHHVAVTVIRAASDGGKLYVDGQVVLTFDPTSQQGDMTTSAPLLIGLAPESLGLDTNLRGAVDEVSIYRRALSGNEVQAIYASGGAGKCVSNVPPQCVPSPTGLVAWWPMESNGMDVVGGHNGTLAGSYSFVVGEVGSGLDVSGTIGGASVADNPDLDFGPGVDFTIELWTRPVMAATAFGAMGLMDKRVVPNISQSKGYVLAVGEGQLAFQMSDSLDKPFLQTVPAGPELRDGGWHHVAVTVMRAATDGGKLYVDGQVVLTFDPTSQQGDMTTSAPLLIGLAPESLGLDTNLRGGVDEVSIYRKALSGNEVRAIYAAGGGGKCGSNVPPTCVLSPTGLVSWWPMESNVVDVVGGHTGTLAGSYSFVGGEVGSGLDVSGTIGGASVADNPDLDFGPGVDFTIELWTRPVVAATAFGAMGLMDKRVVPNISQSKGYALAVGEGQLAFQMSDSLDKPFLQTPRAGPELRDGEWHHVAVTVVRAVSDGGKLYVDGQVVLTFDPTSQQGDMTTSAPLLIGLAPESLGLDTNLRGGVDEVSIYRRALTQTEVASIYKAGVAGKCHHPPVADASATMGLVLSPNNTNATVVLDGSRSFDPEGEALEYLWFTAGTSEPLATGAVAIVVLPVGTNTISLVVSDGKAAATNTIAVDVITVVEAVERLVTAIDADVSKGASLFATLRAAIASIDRSNPTAAINQLQAFQNQLRAQVEPLDAEGAQTLIQSAQDVIDALSDGTSGSANAGGFQTRFDHLTRGTDGKFRMKFVGQAGRIQVIATTTNMLDWQFIGVARDLGDATFEFEDGSAARFPERFYRVVSP